MIRNFRELYRYRALLGALVVRHLHTRYRGSLLGFLWSLLNPLCLMAVYTVVFHYYMRAGTDEHYTIFLFAGLLPWLWMVSSVNEGVTSIVSSGHLITKSMFPAHILPVVSVLTNLVNFALSLPLLFIFMFASGVPFQAALLALPLLAGIQLFFLKGLAVGLSALNVHFRDVQHIVANVFTLLFFLCPIVYSAALIPERFRFTLALNPFALFTLSYQRIILEGDVPWGSLGMLSLFALLSLLAGHLVFDRYRESFAESL